MDELTIRLRQCALDNAVDHSTPGLTSPAKVLELADVFLSWLNGEDTSTAAATTQTPTPHPFAVGNAGRGHLPPYSGPAAWEDLRAGWGTPKNCGTIYSPDDDAPPCQLPAGHPGAHVSVEGADRWEWVLAEDHYAPYTMRRNDGLNFGLCGEPVPGRTPEKNCTRMAGHDGFHSVPNGDGLPPMEWRTKAEREAATSGSTPQTYGSCTHSYRTAGQTYWCNHAAGHRGNHQQGTVEWQEVQPRTGEDYCSSDKPHGDGVLGCQGKAGHPFPHQNGDTHWADDAASPVHHEAKATCPAMQPIFGTDSYHYCNLRTGHAGEHQDGLDTWT